MVLEGSRKGKKGEKMVDSHLLVSSRMTFQSRGNILSFIRFLNTQKIFSKNSCKRRDYIYAGQRKTFHYKTFICLTSEIHLQLLFALEIVQQVLKVNVRHLTQEGQQAGHILPLPIKKQASPCESINLLIWQSNRQSNASKGSGGAE